VGVTVPSCLEGANQEDRTASGCQHHQTPGSMSTLSLSNSEYSTGKFSITKLQRQKNFQLHIYNQLLRFT
jgi:hypothetical protein